MKKWILSLVLLCILAYGAASLQDEAPEEYEHTIPVTVSVQNDRSQDEHSQENEITIQITKDQIYKGDLLLINKDHPVPISNEAVDTIKLSNHWDLVNGFVIMDHAIRLTPSLLQSFSTMVEAANDDGVVHFMITSGYRDYMEQNKMFEEMGPDYALPAGHSEHNLGLSLDIGSTQEAMEHADEGKWLKNNAWKYGFILRYPKDKTTITGIQYEPWHFRYVGLPHSAIMFEKNFVLEEYLDYLKEQKAIMTTIDGHAYDIYYFPISGPTTIRVPVPEHSSYEISGNNTNGVIVTVDHGKRDKVTADMLPTDQDLVILDE